MNTTGEGTRNRALDGIRGIAVLMVVLLHADALPYGWLGVNIFFALSGYLITGILLDAKGAPVGDVLVPFYMRRTLRILPLSIVVALLTIVVTRAGTEGLWYLSYVQNWRPTPGPTPELGHYWSLAVEEQFYLLWPFVVLALPRARLPLACLSVIVIDCVFRGYLAYVQPAFATEQFRQVATLARADPIAVGALLACLPEPRKYRNLALPLMLVGGTLTALSFRWTTEQSRTSLAYVIGELALALVIGPALLLVLTGSARWLGAAWLAWVGTVSYATYIIHGVLHVTFREHIDSVPLRAAALVSVSLGLAALSWRYFEAPILGLKRRWPMPRADRGRMAGP